MVTSVHIAKITATPIYVDYDPPLGPYQGGNSSTPTRGSSALIVRLETDAGIIGWGEGTGELKMDVGALLRGHHVGDIESAIAKMRQSGLEPGPQSGVEMAMWDALGKAVELPLCRLLGGVIRTRVDFCGCLGLKEPQAAAETARSYIDNWGFRHIKTKAGRDAEEDLRIAGAIQKEIGENAFLRPDANSGYGPDEAEEQMKKMRDLGVRHFEDPCAIDYLDYLVRFRRELGMCILVNMGVGRPEGDRRHAASRGCRLCHARHARGGWSPVRAEGRRYCRGLRRQLSDPLLARFWAQDNCRRPYCGGDAQFFRTQ